MLNLVLAFLLLAATPILNWWTETPASLPHSKHTHVKVTGKVVLVKTELDGDTHIRLQDKDGKSFITAECPLVLPCQKPILGTVITVWGIARFDGEHKWYEVHPVEKWALVVTTDNQQENQ